MIKDFWGIKGLLARVLMVLIRDSKMIEFEVGVGYSTLVLLFLGNTKNGQNLQSLVSKTGQNLQELHILPPGHMCENSSSIALHRL